MWGAEKQRVQDFFGVEWQGFLSCPPDILTDLTCFFPIPQMKRTGTSGSSRGMALYEEEVRLTLLADLASVPMATVKWRGSRCSTKALTCLLATIRGRFP